MIIPFGPQSHTYNIFVTSPSGLGINDGNQYLSRRLDVRDTRQLVTPLTQLWRRPRLPLVVRARFPVPHRRHEFFDERLKRLRPVAVALGVLEQPFLELEFLLGRGRDGCVASVDDESGVFTLGRDVVVRSSGVPYVRFSRSVSVTMADPALTYREQGLRVHS